VLPGPNARRQGASTYPGHDLFRGRGVVRKLSRKLLRGSFTLSVRGRETCVKPKTVSEWGKEKKAFLGTNVKGLRCAAKIAYQVEKALFAAKGIRPPYIIKEGNKGMFEK